MKRTSILALVTLCLALPSASRAQGLPQFLGAVSEGVGEGVERSAAKIAASMEEDLGVTLSCEEARIEENKPLTLTVTAENPRLADTPVAFSLSMPERLSCGEGETWEAVLPAAKVEEDGSVTPSVTTMTRTIALAKGGVSETAQITCEMSMGARFYRAQQEVALCVADVRVTAGIEGPKDHRLEPGDAFSYVLEVANAGTADEDVVLSLLMPAGVSPAGELPQGFVCAGNRLAGTVRALAQQEGEAAAVLTLPMQVEADALSGDSDATRLMSGTLHANGERVQLPRIQVCAPRISAQLIADDPALAAGEETVLRLMVVNEGLVGADITLACQLPQGIEVIKAQEDEPQGEEEAADETPDKAAALPGEDDGTGPDGVPALADEAQQLADAAKPLPGDNNTLVFSWRMDAAKEADSGLAAATKAFEIPVRSTVDQADLEEKLVGAAFTYSVNGGDMQLGDTAALRLYTPSFMGIGLSEWGGVFWACVLMMITVSCLYGAVRAGREKDEYVYCE